MLVQRKVLKGVGHCNAHTAGMLAASMQLQGPFDFPSKWIAIVHVPQIREDTQGHMCM